MSFQHVSTGLDVSSEVVSAKFSSPKAVRQTLAALEEAGVPLEAVQVHKDIIEVTVKTRSMLATVEKTFSS